MNNSEKESPSDELIYSLLEHYQNGRLSDAEKLAVEITRDFPKHEFAWKVLGVLFEATGRKSEALNVNQTAVKLSPQDAEAHNNLGNTLKELGRLEEAEASYNRALVLKPDYSEAHCNLGIALHGLVRLEEAETSYNKAIELKPDFPEAHSNLGITLQKLGRLEEAEKSYNHAIKLRPGYAEAHSNLGNIFKELGRLEDAEARYNLALGLEPNFAEAHNNLGSTLQGLGRLGEAEISLKQAIVLSPQDAEAFNNLGNILKELGRLDEAQASYKQALVLKADFVDGARNLVKLPIGKLDPSALNLCEKAFDVLDDSPEQQIKYLFFRGGLLKHQGFIDQSFNIFCQANQSKSEISKDKMIVEAEKNIDSLKRIDSWVPSFPKLVEKRLTKLFIVGPSKSGKSSLEHILSESSSVKTLHETIKHSQLIENTGLAKSSNELIFETLFYQSENKLLNQGYQVLTSTNPGNIFYSDYLTDIVPNAYFIFVKRDSRDVSPEIFTSEYNSGNLYSYDANEISKYLDVYYRACDTLALKVPNRCLSVSFEEIIQAPENVVDQISGLIGINLQVSSSKRKVAKFEYESLFRNHYAALSS